MCFPEWTGGIYATPTFAGVTSFLLSFSALNGSFLYNSIKRQVLVRAGVSMIAKILE